MKTYLVKASFLGRGIEFKIKAESMADALVNGEQRAKDVYRDSKIFSVHSWADFKVTVREMD